VLAGVAALLLTGCADLTDPVATVRCDPGERQLNTSLVLMAQSVPTAQALPCLRTAPADWGVSDFVARSGSTRYTLWYLHESGGEERGVTVELTRRCDVRGAREVRTGQPGMRQYEQQSRRSGEYRDRRFLVSSGSCVTYRFNLRGVGADQQAARVWDALGLLPREELAAKVRELSDGRLELDPESDG
jgi:hypothetical protein